MGSEEHYPQAANEDIESDSLATVAVSHSQDHSLYSACTRNSLCDFFIKLDWVWSS